MTAVSGRELIGPVAEHLDALHLAGMTSRAIADAAGLHVGTVNRIELRQAAHVYSHTAAAILAVPVKASRRASRAGFVPATTPRRQARALAVIGHSLRAQRARTGIVNSCYFRLIAGRSTVFAEPAARAIDAMYEDWRDKPGPSVRAMTSARKQGWQPPDAWDDDTIGDPDAVPRPTEPDALPDEVLVELAIREQWPLVRIERRIDRAAVVTALAGTGIAPSTVAARLKTSTPVVTKLLAEVAA